MKNIFLITILSLAAFRVHAQRTGPNELHCTEEAITFKANIGSNWHFGSTGIGTRQFSGKIAANPANQRLISDLLLPDPLWSFRVKKTIDTGSPSSSGIPALNRNYSPVLIFRPAVPLNYSYLFNSLFSQTPRLDTARFSFETR